MRGFDEIAELYDVSRGGLARGAHFAGELAAFLPPPPARVLEIGVGTAAVALALAGLGYQIIGIDVSAPMLAQAAPRLPGKLCRADAKDLPFGDATFDAAYATWVMNHLSDPSSALGQVGRVLRPGGQLLVMDRNLIDRGTDPGVVLAEEMHRRLGRSRPALEPRSAWFAELAEAEGLHRRGSTTTAPWTERRTLGQAIAHVRARVFGWDGDEDEWATVILPLLDEFSRRPDADDVEQFHQGHDILILAREAEASI